MRKGFLFILSFLLVFSGTFAGLSLSALAGADTNGFNVQGGLLVKYSGLAPTPVPTPTVTPTVPPTPTPFIATVNEMLTKQTENVFQDTKSIIIKTDFFIEPEDILISSHSIYSSFELLVNGNVISTNRIYYIDARNLSYYTPKPGENAFEISCDLSSYNVGDIVTIRDVYSSVHRGTIGGEFPYMADIVPPTPVSFVIKASELSTANPTVEPTIETTVMPTVNPSPTSTAKTASTLAPTIIPILTVKLDTVAPVIAIAKYNKNLTNKSIVVTASTNDGSLNSTSYTFTKNGSFTFVATDAAGNKSSAIVEITNIDKILPKITVKNSSKKEVKANGKAKGKAIVTVSDANIKSKVIKKNGKIVRWPSHGKLKAKGSYVIIATDKATNKSTFKFKVI